MIASRIRRVLLAGLLVLAGLVWLRVSQGLEGPVLLVVTPEHGLTTADLLSLAAFAVAVILVWPERKAR